MLANALIEFGLALDDLENNLKFVRAATRLRPRLNPMLSWDDLGSEQKGLAQEFMRQGAAEESLLLRGMLVVLSGAFEEFVRRILRDCIAAVNKSVKRYDDLSQPIRMQNALRSGQALTTIFEPPDHLPLDYGQLCKNLGTCISGSESFVLNADAFTIFVSSIGPSHLEEILKRVGVTFKWDDIGRDPEMQKLFSRRNTRETASAAKEFLRIFIQARNKVAHCGSGGMVISEDELTQQVRFFRVFGKALARDVESAVARNMKRT